MHVRCRRARGRKFGPVRGFACRCGDVEASASRIEREIQPNSRETKGGHILSDLNELALDVRVQCGNVGIARWCRSCLLLKFWAGRWVVERLPKCGLIASGGAVFCFHQGDCVAARQFCNGLDSALVASILDDCRGCDRFAGGFFAR